jgi:uncharacterized protein DUF4396
VWSKPDAVPLLFGRPFPPLVLCPVRRPVAPLGWGNVATIALAVILAFFFGYSLTMLPLLRFRSCGSALAVPLLRSRIAHSTALPLAFASDTLSIAVMEIVDNAVMLAVPGAMEAGIWSPLFWGSLAFALAVAFVGAYPVNRHLISRGRGHAVVHQYHGDHQENHGRHSH